MPLLRTGPPFHPREIPRASERPAYLLRFRSGNLYQLHAYLTNKAIEPGWENAEGMLLYPSNGYRFAHSFTLHGRHRIRVATIDLHQPWPEIEKELLGLISTDSGSLEKSEKSS